MPERTSAIPAWAWIVGAVLVIVSVFTGYRMVQTQQYLAAAQSEHESANQAAERARLGRELSLCTANVVAQEFYCSPQEVDVTGDAERQRSKGAQGIDSRRQRGG